MTAPRPSSPVKTPPPAADDFLYVDEREIPEALALGARFVEGDARLARPRPLPEGVSSRSFERWQSAEARYRWCMRLVAQILGDAVPVPEFDEMMSTLGAGQAAHERAYLFVPAYDIPRVREIAGVVWDKRRRMYYATPQADLNQLFCWLTPAAKSIWDGERVIQRALTLLVQDCARREAQAPGAGSAAETGAVTIKDRHDLSDFTLGDAPASGDGR